MMFYDLGSRKFVMRGKYIRIRHDGEDKSWLDYFGSWRKLPLPYCPLYRRPVMKLEVGHLSYVQLRLINTKGVIYILDFSPQLKTAVLPLVYSYMQFLIFMRETFLLSFPPIRIWNFLYLLFFMKLRLNA